MLIPSFPFVLTVTVETVLHPFMYLYVCVHVHVCSCVEACLNGCVEVRQIYSVSQTLIILYVHPTLIKAKKIGAATSV